MASTLEPEGTDVERVAGLLTARGSAGLVGQLEAGVRTGVLAPGTRLPPIRSLARYLGVDANTVAAAYRTARDRGLVETAGRAGTRVRARPPAVSSAALPVALPLGVLDLAHGSPDPALLPPVVLPDVAGWDVGYLEARSVLLAEPLAGAGARVLAEDGVPIEELTAVSGALDGIERVLQAHLRPGARVAVEDPVWANLLDLLGVLDHAVLPVAGDDDGPLPEALAAALSAGAQALVLTNRAQNPSGAALSPARGEQLREVLAARDGVLVVEDDHGADLSTMPLTTLAGATRHWAHVRSASKAFGPDLRCALLAGDATTVGRVAGRLRLGPGWVSHVLQHAAAAAWTTQRGAAREAGLVYDQRRQALLDALGEHGVPARGRSGLNVWVPVRDEAAAVAGLLAQGYAVAPGSRYRVSSPAAVRISTSRLPVDRAGAVAAAVARVAGASGVFGAV